MSTTPHSILAATDFSETAARAIEVARDLGRRFTAHLHLLHAALLLDDPHLEHERRSQIEELLTASEISRRQALEESYEEEHGVEITPHIVRGIAPGEVIVETAGTLGCDLIVMGTNGRRGLSHLFLGSVAERVVRTSPAPVLTVRADAEINPNGFSRILVPHDFSDASVSALEAAAAWGKALGAELTLFHVVEPVVYPEFYSVDSLSEDLMERVVERSEEALRNVANSLPDFNGSTRVEVGRAAETIVEFADPGSYDLVVMATRGLSGLEHALLGSVAESVLRRSRVPLLAIPGE
jgi:nucleotide-binding universal stress UspA family protein